MRIQNIINSLANRWVIFTLITWVILAVVIIFVFTNNWKSETLRNQKIELSREIEMLSEKKDYIEAGKEKLNLEDKKLSVILSDLLSASKKSGASLGETQIAEVIEHDNYRSLPVTISIKGNYNQIGKFINLLEKNLQFQIMEVNLSTKETKGKGIICTIKAEFVII